MLDVSVTTTPIGFKWIYEEMLKGDVLVGGEESGGIGIPQHVRERDGLLMTLLLCEMMAATDCEGSSKDEGTAGKTLKQLVAELQEITGQLYYQRDDIKLDDGHMDDFRKSLPVLAPAMLAGAAVKEHIHVDGAKFLLPDDQWLLLRASGTEPLVRIYAESDSLQRTEELIAAGRQLVDSCRFEDSIDLSNGDVQ
jgi:phosphomannomutase